MLIDQPWGVSAFGQGTVHSEPDHAVLRVAINRVSNDPAASLRDAKTVASKVRNSLRELRIPDVDVTSSRTSVRSAWDGFGANRKFLGHQCRIEFSVRVAELDVVESAVLNLVGAGADEIISVTYETTRKAELRAEARRQAVNAAQTKAQLYAEASGVRLGPVVHIEDVDPVQLNIESHRAPMGGGAAAGDDLAPGQVAVSAAVAIGFSI